MELTSPDLWDIKQVSQKINIKVATLRKFVACNEIPFCKFGRLVRFEPEAIVEWVNGNKRNEAHTKCRSLVRGNGHDGDTLFADVVTSASV
jgi:excisionase family DNA binding protein